MVYDQQMFQVTSFCPTDVLKCNRIVMQYWLCEGG